MPICAYMLRLGITHTIHGTDMFTYMNGWFSYGKCRKYTSPMDGMSTNSDMNIFGMISTEGMSELVRSLGILKTRHGINMQQMVIGSM